MSGRPTVEAVYDRRQSGNWRERRRYRAPLQGPNSTYEFNFRRVLARDRFSPFPSGRGREARARWGEASI